MSGWIQQVLQSSSPGVAVLPAAFMIGMLGAVSSCCNLAVVGAIVGYSGSLSQDRERRQIWLAGLFFMIGTIVALTALGAILGLVGRVAGATMGAYWQLAAGLIVVFFGLASLNLIPFKLPGLSLGDRFARRGVVGSMVYGLALGGATTSCSVGCNPLIPLALGYATVQGGTAWSIAVLAAFALGYSLPLAGGLVGLGLGLGQLQRLASKVAPVMRPVAGVLLIGVGFYLLATV